MATTDLAVKRTSSVITPTPTPALNGINISINISVNYSVNNSVNNLVTTSKGDPLGEWLVKSGDTEILEVAKHRDT